jgi:hypothetical protein
MRPPGAAGTRSGETRQKSFDHRDSEGTEKDDEGGAPHSCNPGQENEPQRHRVHREGAERGKKRSEAAPMIREFGA